MQDLLKAIQGQSSTWRNVNGNTVAGDVHLDDTEYVIAEPIVFKHHFNLALRFGVGTTIYPAWTDPTKDALQFTGCNRCTVTGGSWDTRNGVIRSMLRFERDPLTQASANYNRIDNVQLNGRYNTGVIWRGCELGTIHRLYAESEYAPALRIAQGGSTMQTLRISDCMLRNATGPSVHVRCISDTGAPMRMSDILFNGGCLSHGGVQIDTSGDLRGITFQDVRAECNESDIGISVNCIGNVGVTRLRILGGSWYQRKQLLYGTGCFNDCVVEDVETYSYNDGDWDETDRPLIDVGQWTGQVSRVGRFVQGDQTPGHANRVLRVGGNIVL